LAKDVEIWKAAIEVIRDCGTRQDPKAFAFTRSSELHALGDLEQATRWVEIAHAIEAILEEVPDAATIPETTH
jgi:hypothetical protein